MSNILTKEQESGLVAALQTLHMAMTRFALAGAVDEIGEKAVDALRQALIIPLAVLNTTDEDYHEKYAAAKRAEAFAQEIKQTLLQA